MIDERYSLNKLIRKCPDFMHEPTMLQYVGKTKLAMRVDRTPKCTPEVAGEGVEYCWACAKGWYRRQPHSSKNTKDSFYKLVGVCLGSRVLSVERARMFSRRAREFMVAYWQHAKEGKAATPASLKRVNKKMKRHRDVGDIEFKWISDMMKGIVSAMKQHQAEDGPVMGATSTQLTF